MQPADNDRRRMYGDLAWTWPIFSGRDNYVVEAEDFTARIRSYSSIQVETLLHLGCGCGQLDWTLKKHFGVTGVDISPDMLAMARAQNPEVTYHLGDMRTVRLGRIFDAVMVADSIDYMLREQELRAAFETALLHLKPDGVFCTYAEHTCERFNQNDTQCSAHSRGGVDLAFFENSYDPDPTDTTFEYTAVYLIRRDGALQIETDRHLCGLFPLQTWLDLLREVGFQVTLAETPEDACPFFICRR